jgi:hypothetical protein
MQAHLHAKEIIESGDGNRICRQASPCRVERFAIAIHEHSGAAVCACECIEAQPAGPLTLLP